MPLEFRSISGADANLSSPFILIGEDDLDDVDLLREAFASVDDSFSLYFLTNGLEIIEFLNQLPDQVLPCLLVLDYNMPKLNGAEILRKLGENERYANIPKMIWSTSDSSVFRQICMEVGARDYIIKPSNLNELTNIVKYMLSLC